MKRYHQGRVWGWLHRHPAAQLSQVVAGTGLPKHTVKTALYKLRLRGCTRYDGVTTRGGCWYTTKLEPVDLRGTSPGSLANLDLCPIERARRIRAMQIGKGRDPDKPRVGPYTPKGQTYVCALQKCWPTSVLSLTQDADIAA